MKFKVGDMFKIKKRKDTLILGIITNVTKERYQWIWVDQPYENPSSTGGVWHSIGDLNWELVNNAC